MSTFDTTTVRTTRAPGFSIGTVGAVVGAVIAVGLAALFLALGNSSQVKPVNHAHPLPAYTPLIQYRGTGASPASATTPSPSVPTHALQRKSYGAVP
jgi:hypothetical protein